VRVPSGEPELVRAGAAGDPAALAALWDAYGARLFAFSQRVLGRADAAADAAQDAFLLAHAQLGSLARAGESFGNAVFRAARTTSYDLLARDRAAGGGRRAAAAGRATAAQAREPAAARDAVARPRAGARAARSCRSRAAHRRRPRRRASRRELHARDHGAGSRGGHAAQDDDGAAGSATVDPGGAAGDERARPRR
jgi:DNA-directed RNA polymerase specialized sigma24 family protein